MLFLPNTVAEVEGCNGLKAYDVTVSGAPRLRVYEYGAHVVSWKPKDHEPVIWLSQESHFVPGLPIRGGDPKCWPWFGPGDDLTSMHGSARLKQWELVSGKRLSGVGTQLNFRLQAQAWERSTCDLLYGIAVFPKHLFLSWKISNVGGMPVTFEDMIHTYFAVSDVRLISLSGLQERNYVDRISGGSKTQGREPIRFNGQQETCQLYQQGPACCIIDDPILRRLIFIQVEHSKSTVVWSPDEKKAKQMTDFGNLEWSQMLCVETGDVMENRVTLAPGRSHSIAVCITVKKQ